MWCVINYKDQNVNKKMNERKMNGEGRNIFFKREKKEEEVNQNKWEKGRKEKKKNEEKKRKRMRLEKKSRRIKRRRIKGKWDKKYIYLSY